MSVIEIIALVAELVQNVVGAGKQDWPGPEVEDVGAGVCSLGQFPFRLAPYTNALNIDVSFAAWRPAAVFRRRLRHAANGQGLAPAVRPGAFRPLSGTFPVVG